MRKIKGGGETSFQINAKCKMLRQGFNSKYKIKRIQKYAREGNLANESVRDSFMDLAVYAHGEHYWIKSKDTKIFSNIDDTVNYLAERLNFLKNSGGV